MDLVLVLVAVVALIVVATTALKAHPFLALLLGAFAAGLGFRLPLEDLVATVTGGFGAILGGIGIVIVLGTVIGVVLERSGAAVTMAESVIRVLGPRFPTLTMTIVGFIVSIPVFCDSGYVILNSLKESIARRTGTSLVAMSVALATGLYATHTLVPPTPGPIAAAGNLGLGDQLGLVIIVGLLVAVPAALAGLLWANRFRDTAPDGEGADELRPVAEDVEALKQRYGRLPGAGSAFAPIAVPVLLICLGSVAALPGAPFGEGAVTTVVRFLGQPVVALLVGLAFALRLIRPQDGGSRRRRFHDDVADGLTASAPILLITGAGGAFGAVIQASGIGDYLGESLSALGIGVLMPFLVSAALKSAQGSSTVALVTTSALVAPLLGDIGMDSDLGRVLVVMAIGAGAMTVSHANDSFFWVVSQFSRMSVTQAYRAQTAATLVMGLTTAAVTWALSLVLV